MLGERGRPMLMATVAEWQFTPFSGSMVIYPSFRFPLHYGVSNLVLHEVETS